MGKVSKNARVAQRAANAGSGKDFVKVIKTFKSDKSGGYTFVEKMVHKDKVNDYIKEG
ncbi:MAG: DUF4295 domain-containing protein [Saprospiraceae bacterium]|nr:DUF4295 domain-containing protein [Saprospiraceae bacterium]